MNSQHRADEVDDRRRLRGRAHPGAPHQGAWKPGWPTRSCSRPTPTPNTPPSSRSTWPTSRSRSLRLPERSGRRQAAVRRGRHEDRRGLHRFLHDQHRPLPRRRASCCEGKRDIPVKLWIAPPTKMDAQQLTEEGYYGIFGNAGARMEMPGCSLCMGNQAQVRTERHRDVDLDPQLPEPSGQRTRTSTWLRPSWRRLLRSWVACRPSRST